MRRCEIAGLLVLGGLLTACLTLPAPTQAIPGQTAQAPAANRIAADSPLYHIEWNGSTGAIVRKAFGQEPESRQSLVYLHSDSGPTGFAKYLAWFLGRDAQGFSLLWCYLNDSGREFDCWLYRYPSNELTTVHFSGNYQYAPPAEPVPPALLDELKLGAPPPYSGPAFTYRNWTRAFGGLPQLQLRATKSKPDANEKPENGAVLKTISQILVRPLHQVEVGGANGWREGGWHELHALATDSAQDPYYLILYSNTTKGYVVDLKRAQIYTAEFGDRVSFADEPSTGLGNNGLNTQPEIKVHRYERFEIVLTDPDSSADLYRAIQAGIEFTGPDLRPVRVPGFWDGAGNVRVRFTPTLPGIWRWRSLARKNNDETYAELSGKTGIFECILENSGVKGFVNVQPSHRDTHHFAYSNGDAFLPVMLREPTATFIPAGGGARTAAAAGQEEGTAPAIAFQAFVGRAARMGFTRLAGGALLGPAASRTVRSNEGGPAFLDADLAKINPEFFQSMDRRIGFCNAQGIVPDIGIGTLEDSLFTTYDPDALLRFWGYVVARYATYDVQWTLFEPGDGAVSPETRRGAEKFAELTRLYDYNHHPLTSVAVPTPLTLAPVAPKAPGAAAASSRASGSALGGAAAAPKQIVPYNLPWEDVITLLGGDIATLPNYDSIWKPLVVLERQAPGKDGALTPEVTRHRMWETRMHGAYWCPGNVSDSNAASSLNGPELQWAAHCGEFFRRTRFYRLVPHPEMLGGPAESPADRKRRKKAEAAAQAQRPAPPVDDAAPPDDFDPFDTDPLADLPPPPAPKPTPMFVLADPAKEYVVYFEQGGTLLLDLLEATGKVEQTWYNPRTGEFGATKQIRGGAYTSFTAPDENDWVLYLSRL